MKLQLQIVTGCLGILILLSGLVLPVSAQQVEEPIATDAGQAANQIQTQVFEKPHLDDQIADVRATYRSQLETYRTAERQYILAKEQYLKLNTLASLEAAVKATQQAMVSRDQVLTSYVTLLRLKLIDATGVNLTQKEPTLQELEAVLADLQNHTQQATAATDRYAVAESAVAFQTLGLRVEAVAYQTLSMLTIGDLQSVYDKSVSLNQEIKAHLSSNSADIRAAERQRAMTEIERELSDVQFLFTEVNTLVEKEDRKFTRSFYSRLSKNLESVYVGLSQTLGHMAEVLRL